MYNSKTISLTVSVTDVGPPYKYNEPTYTIYLTVMPHKFVTNKM